MISQVRSASPEVARVPLGVRLSFPDLYERIARGRNGALLETQGASGNAILVWDPALTVAVTGPMISVAGTDRGSPVPVPRSPEALPEFLQRVLHRYRIDPEPAVRPTAPFVGGWVGFVGYEWCAAQERPNARRLAGFPDAWFGLYDRAIVQSPDSGPELVVVPKVRGARVRTVQHELSGLLAGRETSRRPDPAAATLAASWSRSGFEAGVREIRARIRRGDVYQVNLALRLESPRLDPVALFRELRERNPSPYAGLLEADGFSVVSGSPERLLRVGYGGDGERFAETRPIAGTRPRGPGSVDRARERALRRSPKERAEHTMLVDLSRNDLGRVCALGSVEVDEWLTVERYSHVMHLVSNVRGILPPSVGLPDLFRALFPGGSVTGTPKIRATEVISALEPVARGPYTGALGYASFDGRADFNILIRSAYAPRDGSKTFVYAGAGIVQDSRPDREWAEVQAKAAALVEAATGARPRGYAPQPPRRFAAWRPPRAAAGPADRRVLLVDNYDSFTYNLAQYLAGLGAEVRVVRNDAESMARLRAWRPTHVVLSPGPGRPTESGVTLPAVREFEGVPLLGVCLGHQAIVEAYGGVVGEARRPVHGKVASIEVDPSSRRGTLFRGGPGRFRAARYHSLAARSVPAVLRVTARSADGEVMAVEHRTLPTFGVQFHPESLRTEGGLALLARFLSVEPKRGRSDAAS